MQYNTGGGFQDYIAHEGHEPIDGTGATAIIFGGFGFNERQVRLHTSGNVWLKGRVSVSVSVCALSRRKEERRERGKR